MMMMRMMMKKKVLGGTMRMDGFRQIVDESADDCVETEIKNVFTFWNRCIESGPIFFL